MMAAVYGLAGWAVVGLIGFAYRYWRKRTEPKRVLARVKEQISEGKIPEDYTVLEQEVRDLNNAQEESTREGNEMDFDIEQFDNRRHLLGNLTRIRGVTAKVREAGWSVGNNAIHRGETIEQALMKNPYSKRTHPGERKQWIRGCCMGASKTVVYNPADYK